MAFDGLGLQAVEMLLTGFGLGGILLAQPIIMKDSNSNYFGRVVPLLVLTAMVATSCSKRQSADGAKGDPKATMEFWMLLQKPLAKNTLYTRAAGIDEASASSQDLQAMAEVMREMGQACRQRAAEIAGAPVAGVDADAANFGVKKAGLLNEYAGALDGIAKGIEAQTQLFDGQNFALGYLFALARHSDEGEDAWGNALKEEFVVKAKTFGNMQVQGQTVAALMERLQGATGSMQTLEMQTRVTLAQRYGKEFPTSSALAANKSDRPALLDAAKLTDWKQPAMSSLIGRKITSSAEGVWTFDEGEFQSFVVGGGTNYGDVVDLDVSTHVRGNFSGNEHDFHLLLTYGVAKDHRKLMFVRPL